MIANIMEALSKNQIGGGDFVKLFEEKVASFLGVKYAVAVTNGSMADIIALACLKHLYPKKTEVIVPALTFIAHTNSVLVNGLKPVFVDVDLNCQIDVEKIREKITDDTLCIFPANLLGKECDMEVIMSLAKEYNIPVIEDSCEAFGIAPKGDFATYSFYPSHTITTGEGGMIATNSKELYELAKKIRNHGRESDEILYKFHFDAIGFNGKMANIIAAIGCDSIDYASQAIKSRRLNVEALNGILGLNWHATSPHCYPMMYEDMIRRDMKLVELEDNGIEARKLFSCLPLEECYKDLGHKMGEFPVAEEIGRRGLFVPIHQDLSIDDINKISGVL